MRHYFLGAAAGYTGVEVWRHTFAVGFEKDRKELIDYLSSRYGGRAISCKNGRSALALALKAYFKPGDAVLVNGFTCYAVYEAIKAAKLTPVWVDISKEDLNYDKETLAASMKFGDSRLAPARPSTEVVRQSSPRKNEQVRSSLGSFGGLLRGSGAHPAPVVADGLELPNSHTRIRGIIIQNTLGNPVDIGAVEKFAKRHDLVIVEDLAHCVGVRYADGREAGTVGAACALSFGKDKAIDTVSGGAVVLRDPCLNEIEAPSKTPKLSDHLRARFYPLFGAMYRGLSYVRLNGVLMRCLLKIHWVERSADNKLDLTRKISKFEAKLALEQMKKLRKAGEPPLREFYLVQDRDEVLKQLAGAKYYFGGFWYEKPVSPERYYKKVHFPEEECPNAVYVAKHIVNLPNYYNKRDLTPARKIIEEFIIKEGE